MTENDDAADAPDPGAQQHPVERPVEPPVDQPVAPVLKTRWRDRAWTLRAMIAVALASFLIGGLVGGVIVGATGDDHDGQRMHRMGPWGPGMQRAPGWRHRQFNDGRPQQPPGMMPYGVPTAPAPTAPAPTAPAPSPGSTG
jgi:hypothetical protein